MDSLVTSVTSTACLPLKKRSGLPIQKWGPVLARSQPTLQMIPLRRMIRGAMASVVVCGMLLGGMAFAGTEPSGSPRDTSDVAGPALIIQRQVSEVHVSFVIEDHHKRLIPNVGRDEIRLFADGLPIERITSFEESSDLPLQLALLIDCSDSMQKNFVQERRAAQAFARRLLRPEIDSLLLVDFAGQSSLSNMTGRSPSLLATKLNSLEAAGHTAIYDAIYETATLTLKSADENQPVRRVMILLTDGDDNDSRHARAEAIDMAQRAGIVIYAVSAHSKRHVYQGDAILRHMTEATGGRTYVLGRFDQVDKVFAQIEAQLRNQYSLTFQAPEPSQCGYHPLEVRHRDRKLQVRARAGYYTCAP